MREESVRKRAGRVYERHPYPVEGTQVHSVFKVLYDNRGAVVLLPEELRTLMGRHSSVLRTLRDSYLLDIRRFGRFQYSLVGEWIKDKYIDYVAERRKNDGTL